MALPLTSVNFWNSSPYYNRLKVRIFNEVEGSLLSLPLPGQTFILLSTPVTPSTPWNYQVSPHLFNLPNQHPGHLIHVLSRVLTEDVKTELFNTPLTTVGVSILYVLLLVHISSTTQPRLCSPPSRRGVSRFTSNPYTRTTSGLPSESDPQPLKSRVSTSNLGTLTYFTGSLPLDRSVLLTRRLSRDPGSSGCLFLCGWFLRFSL